jgi:uncharacterized membrane protein YjfL (UPF0719 family)
MTPEKKYEIVAWLIGALVGAVIIGVMLTISFWLYPGDELKLVRFFVSYIPTVVFGVLVMAASLVFIDFISPINFLTGIEDGNLACAVLGGCIVLGVALLLCFT